MLVGGDAFFFYEFIVGIAQVHPDGLLLLHLVDVALGGLIEYGTHVHGLSRSVDGAVGVDDNIVHWAVVAVVAVES